MLRALRTVISTGLMTALLAIWGSVAARVVEEAADLAELSLEELMNIEVTLTARKPQRLSDAAAAIFVITQDDIHRSGVTSIAEALRMVPGLQVSRISSNQWAITSRGFNGRFANKLLVLMDGRSVYTPAFSGVFWEAQDTLLEDIERIEVIRGPGAALWGANAVNGIINIITKHAQDTQGGLVTAGAGTEERGFGALRYGARVGEDAYLRAYAKYFHRDGFVDTEGEDTPDDWHQGRTGFRLDWRAATHDRLTVQGDAYQGKAGQWLTIASLVSPLRQTVAQDADMSGANLLARWQRVLSPSSEMALQVYYDRTQRDDPIMEEVRDTFDIDFQHRFALGERHEVVWGLGYRYSHDDLTRTFIASADPESRDTHLVSAFVQDDIALIPDRWRLTLDSKFEHNDFTGVEVQPNVRLLWTPDERQAVWAALSRAVRTPSRAEDDYRVNFIGPSIPGILATMQGNRDFDAETLLAYELGYRVQPADRLTLDIAAFYNVYDDLRTFEPGRPVVELVPLPPHLLIPSLAKNRGSGNAWGVELAADGRLCDGWRLQLAYTYWDIDLETDAGGRDVNLDDEEDTSPRHQVSLRSSTSLTHTLDLDLWLRYTDGFDGFGVSSPIGSHTALDLRLAWRPHKDLELSIVGQNLLDDRHLEFTSEFLTSGIEVERGVYGKVSWRF